MNPPPGWFPDPAAPHQLRWWDGSSWTSSTTPAGLVADSGPGKALGIPSATTHHPFAAPTDFGAGAPWPGPQLPVASTPANAVPAYSPSLIAALLASVGVIVGSLAPWATFMAFTKNGIDGDGWMTLGIGVLSAIALFSILTRGGKAHRGDRWIGAGAGVICLVISIASIMDVMSQTTEVFDRTIGIQVGWGLWLVAISSATLFLTGLTVAKQTRRI